MVRIHPCFLVTDVHLESSNNRKGPASRFIATTLKKFPKNGDSIFFADVRLKISENHNSTYVPLRGSKFQRFPTRLSLLTILIANFRLNKIYQYRN